MQAHGVARGVVQNKDQKIKLQDVMKADRQIMEQRFQVSLLRYGFADDEKRFELTAGMLQAGRSGCVDRSFLRILHKIENSTRFGAFKTSDAECASALDLRILCAR